jgi:hypothetical protein
MQSPVGLTILVELRVEPPEVANEYGRKAISGPGGL